MHGLTVAEAILLVKKKIAQWWHHEQTVQNDMHTLMEIITGVGLHSKNGQAKLKPAVLQFLNEEGWHTEELPGKIIVRGIQANEK